MREHAQDGLPAFGFQNAAIGIDGGQQLDDDLLARLRAAARDAQRGRKVLNVVRERRMIHVDADACYDGGCFELRENAACMAVLGYALASMDGPMAK